MSRQKAINPAAPFQPLNAAALMTGLSRWYLMEGCKAGTVPYIRVGTDYRINMPLLLEQLQAATEGGARRER